MEDDEKKELDELLEAANGSPSKKLVDTFQKTADKFDWASVEDAVVKYYSEKDVKLAELYGKKAQEGSNKKEHALKKLQFLSEKYGASKEKQWINYTKAQIFKVDPRATQVRVHTSSPMQEIRFELILNDGYNVTQSITDEMLHWALQTGEKALQHVTNSLVQDFKNKIKYTHPIPKPPLGMVNNQYDFSKYEFQPLVDNKDWQKLFSESVLSAEKYYKSIGLVSGPPSVNKLELSSPPTPPEKDKEFDTGPELAYNKAISQVKLKSLQHKSVYDNWGNLKKEVNDQLKKTAKILEEAKAKQKKIYQKQYGFNGTRVKDNLREVLPCLYQIVKCPGCKHEMQLSEVIICLNDNHDWTREAIADWSESLDIDISVREKEDNE